MNKPLCTKQVRKLFRIVSIFTRWAATYLLKDEDMLYVPSHAGDDLGWKMVLTLRNEIIANFDAEVDTIHLYHGSDSQFNIGRCCILFKPKLIKVY